MTKGLQTSKYIWEDDLHFAENIDGYKMGGYHPVHIGDRFPSRNNPRYQVLHKLGSGAFSTVWLAKDSIANRCVALKIMVARLTGDNGEAAVLKRLATRPLDHPGASHIAQLHDYFHIQGPNGTHQVLVMDILLLSHKLQAPDLLRVTESLPPTTFRASVSSSGGNSAWRLDLHFGNIGFKIPECTEDQLLEWIGWPELTPIAPRNASAESDCLPKYIVKPGDITDEMPDHVWEQQQAHLFLQITGFGNAFRLEDALSSPKVMPAIRAPELTFRTLSDGQVEDEWSFPSDVWSAACTMTKIAQNSIALLARICPGNLIIDPDTQWRIKWRNELEGSEMDSDTQQRTTRADGELDADEKVENFVDLLRVMLRWEPTDRPTAADLLKHHWFATSSSSASELWSVTLLAVFLFIDVWIVRHKKIIRLRGDTLITKAAIEASQPEMLIEIKSAGATVYLASVETGSALNKTLVQKWTSLF
ncbi:kinase-like protein [Rhizopogon salebrosus TDB-379]|nr:kinase-like protein [Rhizopogon salebrosus TDB-379]